MFKLMHIAHDRLLLPPIMPIPKQITPYTLVSPGLYLLMSKCTVMTSAPVLLLSIPPECARV